ncbi:hypothetical protein MRY87_11875 [bacterium]|nr:hypothetical protein [bacterium]
MDSVESAEERVEAKLKAVEAPSMAEESSAEVSEVDVSAGEVSPAATPAPAATAPVAEEPAVAKRDPSAVDEVTKGGETGTLSRGDVSASTIARMMGLATANELSMLEGKIDLISSRVNNVTAKLERVQGALDRIPTSNDLDRIDINVGSLRTLIKETLETLKESAEKERATSDEGTLKKATIMSSSDDE